MFWHALEDSEAGSRGGWWKGAGGGVVTENHNLHWIANPFTRTCNGTVTLQTCTKITYCNQ